MRKFISFLLCLVAGISFGQSNFMGRNSCTIRIQTETVERNFRSNDAAVRFNQPLSQFELHIPVNSLISFNHSETELRFFREMLGNSREIVLIADMPREFNAVMDLSYFKGNRFIELRTVVEIGPQQFITDTYLNGMTINNDRNMIFNFTLCVDLSVLENAIIVDGERIIQIEIFGRSGKIHGLW